MLQDVCQGQALKLGIPHAGGGVKPCTPQEKLWGLNSLLVGHHSALGGVYWVTCLSLPTYFHVGLSSLIQLMQSSPSVVRFNSEEVVSYLVVDLVYCGRGRLQNPPMSCLDLDLFDIRDMTNKVILKGLMES